MSDFQSVTSRQLYKVGECNFCHQALYSGGYPDDGHKCAQMVMIEKQTEATNRLCEILEKLSHKL